MKIICRGVITSVIFLISAGAVHGQDLSKYRNFSFGMSVAVVSKQVSQSPTEAQAIYQQPALIQELTWYPPPPFESSRPAEPVEKVLFSFYNGELYRMLVVYDSSAILGLTNEDMIRALSAKYGAAMRPVANVNFPTHPAYEATEKVIARWEDPQYSVNLFRSSQDYTFAVVMFTKQTDAQAGLSITESMKQDQQQAELQEAAGVKKNADNLEGEREKNIKTFRP